MLQVNKNTRTIYIDGVIGPQEYDGIDAGMIRDALSSLGKLQTITVEINSGGGSCHTGIAICDTLENWTGTINTRVVGLCASAAVDVYLCGQRRFAGQSAQIMVHAPWIITIGGRSDHENTIDALLHCEQAMFTRYRAKLPKTVSDAQIREWTAGTRDNWFDAWGAADVGIVHHVEGTRQAKPVPQSRGQEALARLAINQQRWAAERVVGDAKTKLSSAARSRYIGTTDTIDTAAKRSPGNLWIEDSQVQEAARLDRIRRLQAINDAHYDRQMHFYSHTVKSGRPGKKPVRLDAAKMFPKR
jgi:ATP-dependent protease ClpP protease subunit